MKRAKLLFDINKIKKERTEMKKLMKWIGWLIAGAVISVFLFVVVASQFGWYFNVVMTKSMEPAFSPGGMIITRPVAMENINVGDPILFKKLGIGEREALICHRVIDIKEIDRELYFQTKGDAQERPDPDLVSSQNFLGKTIFYIPQIGNIAYQTHLPKTPITLMGKEISVAVLMIVVIGLILIGMEIKNVWEWMTNPYLKRRQEILKKRKERMKRRSFVVVQWKSDS